MTTPVIPRVLLLAALALMLPASGSSGPKLEGTYTHPSGAPIALDLRPGGKAAFTLMGERFACTYEVQGDQLMLDCSPKGERIDLTINDDGSLSGGEFLGILKKSASAPSGPGAPAAAAPAGAAGKASRGTARALEGTYTHPSGAPITLNLRPGGKAVMNLMGERFACTYEARGDQLTVDCSPQGERIDFTINDDGSLSGGALLGVLTKSASGPAESGPPATPEPAGAAGQAPPPERKTSSAEREAQAAALAAVQEHWIKAKDGWITARTTGSTAAPVRFLRQFREFAVDRVRSYAVGESDRLNGVEWAGQVWFKQAPCREAGEGGVLLDGDPAGRGIFRQRGRWTQWVDFQPEPVEVLKVNGEWKVPENSWLLKGKRPGPGDFANAGVK